MIVGTDLVQHLYLGTVDNFNPDFVSLKEIAPSASGFSIQSMSIYNLDAVAYTIVFKAITIDNTNLQFNGLKELQVTAQQPTLLGLFP
jgi:hypothetical protein